jgi:hypothetical protein
MISQQGSRSTQTVFKRDQPGERNKLAAVGYAPVRLNEALAGCTHQSTNEWFVESREDF